MTVNIFLTIATDKILKILTLERVSKFKSIIGSSLL